MEASLAALTTVISWSPQRIREMPEAELRQRLRPISEPGHRQAAAAYCASALSTGSIDAEHLEHEVIAARASLEPRRREDEAREQQRALEELMLQVGRIAQADTSPMAALARALLLQQKSTGDVLASWRPKIESWKPPRDIVAVIRAEFESGAPIERDEVRRIIRQYPVPDDVGIQCVIDEPKAIKRSLSGMARRFDPRLRDHTRWLQLGLSVLLRLPPQPEVLLVLKDAMAIFAMLASSLNAERRMWLVPARTGGVASDTGPLEQWRKRFQFDAHEGADVITSALQQDLQTQREELKALQVAAQDGGHAPRRPSPQRRAFPIERPGRMRMRSRSPARPRRGGRQPFPKAGRARKAAPPPS
jgi:hypothetical protein